MIFVYSKWDKFCRFLAEENRLSIPAYEVSEQNGGYIVLKHDVETNVRKAYELAKTEHKYGHRGSYYVQAYLMEDRVNAELLRKMLEMGHEISYHYDVMDSNQGNIKQALREFEENKKKFEDNGFKLVTVCQHGNPIVERKGYSSNRDFFRNSDVQEKFPEIADIMVNFKDKYNTDYNYYSDAGRNFKLIYDPINNDISNSDDKNIKYNSLDELLKVIDFDKGNIISTHPHRWESSSAVYVGKTIMFKCVKTAAKIIAKNSVMKRIMSRYYYLAKKI